MRKYFNLFFKRIIIKNLKLNIKKYRIMEIIFLKPILRTINRKKKLNIIMAINSKGLFIMKF